MLMVDEHKRKLKCTTIQIQKIEIVFGVDITINVFSPLLVATIFLDLTRKKARPRSCAAHAKINRGSGGGPAVAFM